MAPSDIPGILVLKKCLQVSGFAGCCEQSCQTPASHRPPHIHLHVTEYLPPSHNNLQPFHFPLFLFPLSSPLYTAEAGGALLLLSWQGREGQAFTSPLPPAIISLICTPLNSPSLPLLLFTPLSLHLFFFSLTYSNQSAVEWSEERRGRNSRTTMNF